MCELRDAKKGITEMRGQKDLQKEAKKGPVRWRKKGGQMIQERDI